MSFYANTKRDVFYDLVKVSEVLKVGVDHYTREKHKGTRAHDPEDITYDYLRSVADDWLTQQEYDVNLVAQEAEFCTAQMLCQHCPDALSPVHRFMMMTF